MIIAAWICSIGWIVILTVWKIYSTDYIITFSTWDFRRAGQVFRPSDFAEDMLILRKAGVQKDPICYREYYYLYEVKYPNKYKLLGLPIGRILDTITYYIKSN